MRCDSWSDYARDGYAAIGVTSTATPKGLRANVGPVRIGICVTRTVASVRIGDLRRRHICMEARRESRVACVARLPAGLSGRIVQPAARRRTPGNHLVNKGKLWPLFPQSFFSGCATLPAWTLIWPSRLRCVRKPMSFKCQRWLYVDERTARVG